MKIVYWTSIVLLCFWILTAILGLFLPLEISNNDLEFMFDGIRFYGFPVAIILTLTGTIKKKDTTGTMVLKIFITIVISAFSLLVMIMALFAGMCDWTTDKVFFENKHRTSTKIVQRSYGCGATDGSAATIKIVKVKEITPYLIWVASIDTTKINKGEWTRRE